MGSAVVVCKPDTPLPVLPDGVAIWHEPDPRHHPAAGLLEALRRAGTRIAVLGGDMPGVDAALVRQILGGGEGTVVASTPHGLQPLAAAYPPSAAAAFEDALERGAALRAAVESLDPVTVTVEPSLVASANTPDELR